MTDQRVSALCVSIERLLEPCEEDRRHLSECTACAELARDVAGLRERAAAMAPLGWAGEQAPCLDVEAALGSVFGAASRVSARRRRPLFVQLATSLAAAAVLFSLAAPSVLRWRVEASPSAQASGGVQMQGVFWTSVTLARK